MANTPPNVDTGIGDPNAEVETNPVFEEFLRRERTAQEAAGETPSQSPQTAPEAGTPEGTPEAPPESAVSEPGSEAPSEGEPSLAPGAPSAEPPVVEPEGEPPAPAEAVEPEAPEVIEPVQPEPTPPQSWAYGGVEYGQDEVTRMVALDNWARGLNDNQRTAIDLLLSGQYRLAPASEQVQPQPQPQPTPTQVEPEEDDLLDPAIKARFDALNTELTTLRQHAQAQQQQQFAAQQQAIVQSLDSGRQTFQSDHELSDQDAMAMVNEVVGLQVLPSYLAAHNGDGAAAMRAALEAHYWAKPENQQRELDRRIQDNQSQEATQTRTRKVSAITGSGGSTAPRVDPQPADPRQARRDGMVKEIADHLNGNTAN